MAIELSIETNAKKIQTLTKVAKLLRDQIQEQNKKIDTLQVEIIKMKEEFERISKAIGSPLTITQESTNLVTAPSTEDESIQKELQLPRVEKVQEKSPIIGISERSQDDKDQLLKALKVIDEL
ncbi:MAG: hypothetical protein ACFFFH_02100 [Candidatus Thorarchaeota archaeon]